MTTARISVAKAATMFKRRVPRLVLTRCADGRNYKLRANLRMRAVALLS